ncbi:glycosyltransferase family 2 protein [Rhodophyticola sp. MJ-SS7]|nr:glycosyltransferase family 2 protein [Rhodophyticola sp. MJ-SS7]
MHVQPKGSENQSPSVQEGRLDLSIVVPFLNERETLKPLYEQISAVLSELKVSFEVIFVNDGSNDGSREVVAEIASSNDNVLTLNFRRNFGKAAALSAGFERAKGAIVITMDADLQDDPNEIPKFLDAIQKGADVVSGWKRVRNDPLSKTLPSRIFNGLTATIFDIKLHDINCGFKAYRREALRHLNLYGELHRFTPALLAGAGFSIAEVEVQHHAREFGRSKYGWTRFIKGLLDLSTVLLLTRYGARPLHFFALAGLPLLILGSAFVIYLSALWLVGLGPIGTRPLLQIGILFIVTGVQFLGIGLVAELLRASNTSQGEQYIIDTSGEPSE